MKITLRAGSRRARRHQPWRPALVAPSALAATAVPAPAAARAGDWIAASQLTDGIAIGDYGADVGLSIDAGLALDAIGVQQDAERVARRDSDAGAPESDGLRLRQVAEYDYPAPYDSSRWPLRQRHRQGRGVRPAHRRATPARLRRRRPRRPARGPHRRHHRRDRRRQLLRATTPTPSARPSPSRPSPRPGRARRQPPPTRCSPSSAPPATSASLTLGAAACTERAAAPTPPPLTVISLRRVRHRLRQRSPPRSASPRSWLRVRPARRTAPSSGDASAPGAQHQQHRPRGLGARLRRAYGRPRRRPPRGSRASRSPMPARARRRRRPGAIAYDADDLATGRGRRPRRQAGVLASRDVPGRRPPCAGPRRLAGALGVTAPASAAPGAEHRTVTGASSASAAASRPGSSRPSA